MASADYAEDYYGVLELSRDASESDIRRNFQRLVRKYHPDKLPLELGPSERADATRKFHKVTQAYNILSKIEEKKKYDRELNAQEMTQKWPFSDSVDLDDMDFDPDKECYASPCRCGGVYVVRESQLEEGIEIVCCSTCSLNIRILYQVQAET